MELNLNWPKGVRVLFLLSALMLAGCFPTLDITPEEVEEKINSTLKPGDSAEKIEAYFEKEGLGSSYDRFLNRYQSIIRHPESNFHAITIYVYVDENKRFIRIQADDVYAFL